MRCNDYGCNKKATKGYCKKHMQEIFDSKADDRERRFRAERVRDHLIFGIVCTLLFTLMTTCFFVSITKDVDEKSFCLEKIREYFPEYNFESATFNEYEEMCIGKYSETESEQRDGLKMVENEESLKKNFLLTDQKDRDYLKSDNGTESLLAVGIAFMIFLGLAIYVWIDWSKY